MKVLVIIGECVQVNSSANLCHLAYLRGLAEAHNEVTLLSGDAGGDEYDADMRIPDGVKCHTYNCVSLYEKLGKLKRERKSVVISRGEKPAAAAKPSRRIRLRIKDFIRSLYGPYGIYSKFVSKAIQFRSNEIYDVLISISTPASSHLLAHRLLSSGHVKSRHWIQIWEDPWYGDVFCTKNKKAIFKEEKKLLSFAEHVCYVSPITLENQKKLYPESAHKMFWAPLPSYYEQSKGEESVTEKGLFGYFGDYKLPARNLEPFYRAAVKAGAKVNICGNTNMHLEPTDKICIYPRLDLAKLRPIEERTDILVFLCNRSGGQIPGKIYQYAATNKTILFILDGTDDEKKALKTYFDPFNRFVFCENDQADIERAIELINRDKIENISNEPLTQFSPAGIVEQIIEEVMH